jgi:hypothetical protein
MMSERRRWVCCRNRIRDSADWTSASHSSTHINGSFHFITRCRARLPSTFEFPRKVPVISVSECSCLLSPILRISVMIEFD